MFTQKLKVLSILLTCKRFNFLKRNNLFLRLTRSHRPRARQTNREPLALVFALLPPDVAGRVHPHSIAFLFSTWREKRTRRRERLCSVIRVVACSRISPPSGKRRQCVAESHRAREIVLPWRRNAAVVFDVASLVVAQWTRCYYRAAFQSGASSACVQHDGRKVLGSAECDAIARNGVRIDEKTAKSTNQHKFFLS